MTRRESTGVPSGYRRRSIRRQGVDGAAALVEKVGGNAGFPLFLRWLTPKAGITQTMDVSLKLVAENTAFCEDHEGQL
jgi:hypothetical protein